MQALPLTFVCLSYRGYWHSSGRPTEKGIGRDAVAGRHWVAQYQQQLYEGLPDSEKPLPILLVWGQSIGCGVATNLAASGEDFTGLPIKGLILETPFLSLRAMLATLYPQKWLPYRYLWPFLRNHLDSWSNMQTIAESSKRGGMPPPHIFILEAARDELVLAEHSEKLYERCRDLKLPVEREKVPFAYHNEAITRGGGRRAVAEAILRITAHCLAESTAGARSDGSAASTDQS